MKRCARCGAAIATGKEVDLVELRLPGGAPAHYAPPFLLLRPEVGAGALKVRVVHAHDACARELRREEREAAAPDEELEPEEERGPEEHPSDR